VPLVDTDVHITPRSIATGRSWFDPERTRVRAYETSLVAERYPVEVRREHVVVHV
jgi:hypothetical protein